MKKQTVIGFHAVTAVLKNQPERVLEVFIQAGRHDARMDFILQSAKKIGVPIVEETRKELDRLADGMHHQGVLVLCLERRIYVEHDLENILQHADTPLLLVLDGIQDPHNLGACFRTADAFGVHAIIAPKDKSVGITPVVSKVASGAADSVPFIQVTNLVRTLLELKKFNIWIFGADAESEQTLYQADLKGSLAIVMGAEGKGLRRLTREHCDVLVKIPMCGSVASLNVSVATGIFLYEAVRQR